MGAERTIIMARERVVRHVRAVICDQPDAAAPARPAHQARHASRIADWNRTENALASQSRERAICSRNEEGPAVRHAMACAC